VWETLFSTGLAVPASEEFGGGGVPDTITQCVAVEELAYGDPGIALAALWSGSAAMLLSLCGSAEQKQQHLPSLATDPRSRGAIAIYEGFGRAPSEWTTSLRKNGGCWELSGRKVAVAHAAEANPLIVVGLESGSGRLVAAIVPSSSSGVTISPDDRHIALDAAPTFTITMHEEFVPGGEILPADDGVALDQAVGRLRLLLAAANIGCARRAVEYAAAYALQREAFGKPIAAFQGVSFLLAEASMRVQAARLDTHYAASLIDAGESAEEAVSQAVNYASVAATQSTRDSVQVLGGHGFITDHPVELWYRSAAAISAIDFDPLLSSFEPAL
jgi:alkylation response protein AidB-like acyl-CoA dehydrogenase